jgi:dTDP-4-dehydrorhamnose 3,5-epimerase
MIVFSEAALPGAYLVDLAPVSDARGFFARSYSVEEFAAQGLGPPLSQCSVSYNARKATLRGMHYQIAPHEEHKLVRCTAGAIFDVIIDLRPASSHFRRWFGAELNAQNRRALFIPPGFAHGFITLSDHSEVFYMISAAHSPAHARGVRWNDPAFGIEWPLRPSVIAARDAAYPLLDAATADAAVADAAAADAGVGAGGAGAGGSAP